VEGKGIWGATKRERNVAFFLRKMFVLETLLQSTPSRSVDRVSCHVTTCFLLTVPASNR
jgi:hypothetical protein